MNIKSEQMESVIYQDERAINIMTKEADRMPLRVKKLSDAWNKQGIMGKMSRVEFMNLLNGGAAYFMECFEEAIRRNEAKVRGEAFYHLADPSKFSPLPISDDDVNFDAPKMQRIIDSMNKRQPVGLSWDLVAFKEGQPHISKAVYDWIEDRFTVFATPENMATYKEREMDADLLSEMIAKGYEITVKNPFKMDGNKVVFDPSSLKHGSGKRPPKKIEIKRSDPEPAKPAEALSPMQPANLSKGVRRSAE